MPTPTIKNFAKRSGKSEKEVEALYQKAKEIAKEAGEEENFAYIIGILKNMLSINETSFIDFLYRL